MDNPTSSNSSPNLPLPIETLCPSRNSNASSVVLSVETLGMVLSPSSSSSPKTLGMLGFPQEESNNEDEEIRLIGDHHYGYTGNRERFQSRWCMHSASSPPLVVDSWCSAPSYVKNHDGEEWSPWPSSSSSSRGVKLLLYGREQLRQRRDGEECVIEDSQIGQEDGEDKSFGLSLSLMESGPTGVGAGLSNLGNTCFINAILQCFTHTVPLVKALRASTHLMPCGSKEFCVLCTLHEHVELSMASSGKIISPAKFFDNLNYISSVFRRYQQEDAHEFLQCFLDRLERCSLDSNSIENGQSVQGNNLVEQIFGGRLVSKLLCSHCGHCSEKFEPLIDMSLEIEEVNTLESALESFTKVEKIEDPEVKFTCENCKEEASMEKQLMLDQAPLVAALHLKRFKTDGFSVEKISKHVKFPLELDMKPYTNGHNDDSVEVKYQLYAFVVHNGFLPTSGHYFCYVRSSPDTWHKFDDSLVINVEEASVISQSAYILFYAREGTPWFSSLVGLQKLCLDFSIPSTSPKSVLENVDGECTLFPGVDGTDTVKLDIGRESTESNLTDFWDKTNYEFQTNGTMGDAESYASGQNGTNFGRDESEVEIIVVDSSAPVREGDSNEEMQSMKLPSPTSSGKYNQKQGTDNTHIGRDNSLSSLTPPRSLRVDPDPGVLPEARYKHPKRHLKAENRVNNKGSWNKSAMDSQREEAFRYMNKNTPMGRRLTLMAAILPQNAKKRKSRASPCKKAKSPGSRRKFMHNGILALNGSFY